MRSDVIPVLPPSAPPPPRLLDSVRRHLRLKHYSIRTEQSYLDWIKRFILFHGKRHPKEMGEPEVGAFLTHLAVNRNVAASTQNQALSALLFLYQQVLERKLDFMDNIERVKRPPKVPVVLTPREIRSVLTHLKGEYRLMADLLYGSGLRLMECKQIADLLGLSVATVDTHRRNMMAKAEAHNAADLIRYGHKHRLFGAS